jgi:hypothetical protein
MQNFECSPHEIKASAERYVSAWAAYHQYSHALMTFRHALDTERATAIESTRRSFHDRLNLLFECTSSSILQVRDRLWSKALSDALISYVRNDLKLLQDDPETVEHFSILNVHLRATLEQACKPQDVIAFPALSTEFSSARVPSEEPENLDSPDGCVILPMVRSKSTRRDPTAG